LAEVSRVRGAVAVALCLIAVAFVAQGAFASAPDRGLYHCYNGSAPFGDLKLKRGDKYVWNKDSSGSYAYRAASKKVIFKTGVFHKDHWYGKHSRDPSDGSSVIKLYEEGKGSLGITCYGTG
jgi:hypothetical protein